MAYFQVEGGHRLHGEITPQGAKNEALQILCATLLTPRRVVVPQTDAPVLDVMQLHDLLRAMGVEVEQLADDTYAFCAREIDLDYLLTEDYRRRCARLRGSVMLIGPLLARFGVGYVPKPGGDKIGRAAGWTPISLVSRNWEPSSISTPPRSSSRSTAKSCAAATCCLTRRR